MMAQLTLDWPTKAALSRDHFFISPANAHALSVIDDVGLWPQGKMILQGPKGAGKSHLGAIWARDHSSQTVHAASLTLDLAESLSDCHAILVEDADQLGPYPQAQEALFHLHNAQSAAVGLLLITAKSPPRDWGMGLPDLASRMAAMACTKLDAPDDNLLQALLVKLFADRQIDVTSALISALVIRMERYCARAGELVEKLDRASLAANRPISRPFALEILEQMQM